MSRRRCKNLISTALNAYSNTYLSTEIARSGVRQSWHLHETGLGYKGWSNQTPSTSPSSLDHIAFRGGKSYPSILSAAAIEEAPPSRINTNFVMIMVASSCACLSTTVSGSRTHFASRRHLSIGSHNCRSPSQ